MWISSRWGQLHRKWNFHCFPSWFPLSLISFFFLCLLIFICLSLPLHCLVFSLVSVPVSLSILTYSPATPHTPPTSHFPSLSFPLACVFFLLFLGLCPSFVVIEGRSCGRQHTRTHTHSNTHRKRRKQKAGTGMALLVFGSPLRGSVTSSHSLTSLQWCFFLG